mmetsp:Transcript_30368/g.75394  ORF Transcript_30368/g.75394 Transcript_30368/m.75394 type:complete len:253 (-) Transcript_30368:31-789(-)
MIRFPQLAGDGRHGRHPTPGTNNCLAPSDTQCVNFLHSHVGQVRPAQSCRRHKQEPHCTCVLVSFPARHSSSALCPFAPLGNGSFLRSSFCTRKLGLRLLSLLLPGFGLLECHLLCRPAFNWLCRSLALDVLQCEADDGLLHLGCASCLPSRDLLNLALLVHASPCLGPRELHRLDTLVVERVGLGVDEQVVLAVTSNETLTTTWVHTVLTVRARLCLDHHPGEGSHTKSRSSSIGFPAIFPHTGRLPSSPS